MKKTKNNMAWFPRYMNQYKLKVDNTYLVCADGRIKKAKLVRSTKRGFNFEDVKTGKVMFKKQIYPLEYKRDNLEELTFQLIANIIIDEE